MSFEESRYSNHSSPYIIEMVGVAGAGKSTLLREMKKRDPRFTRPPIPSKIFYTPFIFRMISLWMPLYLINARNSRWFTIQETRNMGYLDTWLSYLKTKNNARNIYVFDPGSVYWLSSLNAFGPLLTKNSHYQSWLMRKLEQWSSALSAIIWLDAPEDILHQRVLSRDERHAIKKLSVQDAMNELKGYRDCYEHLVPEMASRHSLKVFHFHTDQVTTEQMIDQIFANVGFWTKLNQPSMDGKPNL